MIPDAVMMRPSLAENVPAGRQMPVSAEKTGATESLNAPVTARPPQGVTRAAHQPAGSARRSNVAIRQSQQKPMAQPGSEYPRDASPRATPSCSQHSTSTPLLGSEHADAPARGLLARRTTGPSCPPAAPTVRAAPPTARAGWPPAKQASQQVRAGGGTCRCCAGPGAANVG